MSKRIALLSAAVFSALAFTATITAPASAEEKTVMVGGAAMFPSKNIVQNAVNSKDHTTLVAAVKAAGLVETLESKGPFTVFAPTNTAFGKLPAGTVDTLVKPENKPTLTKILTYHVVPGKLEALPEAAWDTTMNIGLKGAFLVSQAAAKHMIAQKSGIIVNIASIAGLFPYNWAGAYSVVKAGLIMLTKLQAMEWAPLRHPRQCDHARLYPYARNRGDVCRSGNLRGPAQGRAHGPRRFRRRHRRAGRVPGM